VSTEQIPRPYLEAQLRARVEAGPAFLFGGPPGAGKTTLLLGLAHELEADGWACLYLDLMGAASSPDRFVLSALDALPAERFGDRLREATEIRRLVASGRPQHAQAVRAVLALWGTLDRAGGRPVALLLDEATEIRSLAYFPGLREVDRLLVAALGARPRATVLATSFPTLADKCFGLPLLEAPPLTLADIAGALPRGPTAEDLVRASFGWARYVRVLLERVRGGVPLADAWAEEMAKGGRPPHLRDVAAAQSGLRHFESRARGRGPRRRPEPQGPGREDRAHAGSHARLLAVAGRGRCPAYGRQTLLLRGRDGQAVGEAARLGPAGLGR